MNIVNKLTFRHLKSNKGRTVITTLGISVSVALITAVFVCIASFLQLFGELTVYEKGNIHAEFDGLHGEKIEKIKADDRIKAVGLEMYPADSSYKIVDSDSYKAVGSVKAGDENFFEMKVTCDYEGAFPKNENEIAVEKDFIEDNHLDWKVGDTVTLAYGMKYIESEGEKVEVYGMYHSDEKFEERGVREYTITAILHDNAPTSVPFLRGMSESEKKASENTVNIDIQLEKVNYKSFEEMKSIIKKYGIAEAYINTDYLDTKFAINKDSTVFKQILPLLAIVLVIIMIASVMLIYNAFGMSLSERIRYLGMLASVGATKRQKRNSVYYEGLILGAIGIPLGIAVGITGMFVTLKVVGKRIIESGMLGSVTSSDIAMKTVVPIWCIAIIVIVSAFTIFISLAIPARKASRITCIDAIRQNSELKVKARKLKSPRIIRWIFGYEGELAYKSLKRNRRKSRVITISIALSVIMFLSINYFCELFIIATDMGADVPYQVEVQTNYGTREELKAKLEKIPGVDKVYSNCIWRYLQYGKKALESADQTFADSDYLTKAYKKLFDNKIYLCVNVLEDETFNNLCENNGLDHTQYYGDKIKGVLMNNISHKTSGSKVFNDKILGQIIRSEDDSDRSVEVVEFVDYDKKNYVCNLNPSGIISVYVPESVYYQNYKEMSSGVTEDEISYSFGVETKKHAEVTKAIEELLSEGEYRNTYCQDYVENYQLMNTIVFVIEVFMYGFVVLITLITAANIINTISTGIMLRRKEFAMLKSVGTTPRGFRKMICLESLFYGLKALIVGIPVSILICWKLNITLASDTTPFEINYGMYGIVIFTVFAIIGLTMLYALSRLRSDSIVETLKEEIN